MKQTAFWRERNGEYISCLKYLLALRCDHYRCRKGQRVKIPVHFAPRILRFAICLFPSCFTHVNPVSFQSLTCNVPCPSQPLGFVYPNNVWCKVNFWSSSCVMFSVLLFRPSTGVHIVTVQFHLTQATFSTPPLGGVEKNGGMFVSAKLHGVTSCKTEVFLISSLFCDFTQLGLVGTDVSGHSVIPIFSYQSQPRNTTEELRTDLSRGVRPKPRGGFCRFNWTSCLTYSDTSANEDN